MPKEVKQKPRVEVDSKREEEARARREFGIERLTEGEELIDEDSFAEMHSKLTRGQTNWGEPVSEAEASEIGVDDLLMAESASGDAGSSGVHQQAGPPDHPGEVVGLERDLLVARSHEEIVHLTLRIARYHARAAALFVVQRDMVAGIRGSGDGMEDGIEGIMIPSGAESRIARPIETKRLTRVWAPLEGVDLRVLKGPGPERCQGVRSVPDRHRGPRDQSALRGQRAGPDARDLYRRPARAVQRHRPCLPTHDPQGESCAQQLVRMIAEGTPSIPRQSP